MPNDFQPLNLKEKRNQPIGQGFSAPKQASNSNINRSEKSKTSVNNNLTLEKIYQEHGSNLPEMKKFTKPQSTSKLKLSFNLKERTKMILIIAVVVIVVLTGLIWLFVNYQAKKQDVVKEISWYAVKLINGEIFYGQIGNTSADPIVMEKVYYNYGQLKDKTQEANPSGNLRLVKRGKETHGPSGIMEIVRAQIVYMEPMKEDSRVLQAILEYEK
jgi:hypothetical protein